ncbi:DUF6491 family protein [Kordiimonas sp.]|uniref:DUF6491 family protein n=1 Tax=Kordiimonas sp. TaxID=1970157 RepID=UPI003A921528
MQPRAFAFSVIIMLAGLSPALAQEEESGAARRPLPGEPGAQCIDTDKIVSYQTVSDELIRFELTDHHVMARLRKNCPQMHYHGYISYQPVNGQLCARFDDVVSRSGMPCRIESLTELPLPSNNEQTAEAAPGR